MTEKTTHLEAILDDAAAAMYSQFQAQISALQRALMRRVQEDNCCRATGVDCDARGGGMLCSCSLEAQNEIEESSIRKAT